MPDVKVFIDTNILLYAHDRKNPHKRELARAWLEDLARRECAQINLQVLNELTCVLLRKNWFDSPIAAFAIVDQFAAFGDRSINRAEVEFARTLHLQTSYSWWDCLLLASALELKCRYFLSEDLHDGHAIEGLTIVNPFLHRAGDILR